MKKGEQGLAPFVVLNHVIFGSTHYHIYFFVDLALDIASNWHGVKAMRNLGPIKDLIGAMVRQDPTATHLISKMDHFPLGVAAPWWLHAW